MSNPLQRLVDRALRRAREEARQQGHVVPEEGRVVCTLCDARGVDLSGRCR